MTEPFIVDTLLWGLPFAGLLLSIALFPLFAPSFWHAHYGKISAFWAIVFVIPFTVAFGVSIAFHEVFHILLLDYFPFVVVLATLYTISGGIRLQGDFLPTPAVNTIFLTLGTAIASWIGTTGASMLFIRPLLAINEKRRYKTHVIVFFVFLVANIGGSLTPLGDPPLFLGFLNGIDFFWTTRHMFAPMLFLSVILLAMFWVMDSYYYRKEHPDVAEPPPQRQKLSISGPQNILLLFMVIIVVLMSGVVDLGTWSILGIAVKGERILSPLVMLALIGMSLKWTDKEIRAHNHFNWFPMQEVAKLFFSIFITIIPVLAYLKGNTSVMAPIFERVPEALAYFWLTGILSAFLDNAPTYLVFFNTAGGAEILLANPQILLAISAGAVFMGALTLIGNAPNFLVFAVARERKVSVPSFLGYMAWSFTILTPLFVLVSWIWFL
ncbi:MAG: sodium:proton antiporter [Alphaproteobacteria bacterium GM7ARS4]|nr:sodium:proton antiporter [Alphaproteobacteria bacterium GM7ARS4]